MNAVIYARYSSDKQKEQSIEGQLRNCYDYADRMGYTVIGEYIDRGMSGTRADRPDFQRMIADAQKKQFKYIIVWKLDRFSRNRYDSAIYKSRLKKYGVKVVSVTEGIGDNKESILLEAMLEASAEIYSTQLGENAARGMRENALKGLTTGGNIPLGYKIKDKRLIVDTKTAPIVQYIFSQYDAGKTKTEIVALCKQRGYVTKNGNPFYVNAITSILNNRMYIGDYTYKGEIARTCPALIDPVVFDRVQAKEASCKRARGRKITDEVVYWLSGKLFCGYCKKPMVGDVGTSRNGSKHHYYTCAGRKKQSGCKKKSEKKDFIEWYVCEQTVQYVLDPERIRKISERIVAEYDRTFNYDKVAELEKRLADINRELRACAEALIASRAPSVVEMVNEKADRLEIQKQDTEIELAQMRITARHKPPVEQVEAWLRSFCDGDLFDDDFRRKIIDTLVNAVYLYDDKIIIYYNTKNGQQVSVIEENPDDLIDDSLSECSDCLSQGEPKEDLKTLRFQVFFFVFNPFFFPENIKREKAIAAQIIEKIFSLSKLFRHLYRKLDQ